MSSTTELTGLVPGVGVLLFEADSTQTPFINMPLLELHACVWNYHIGLITNANVVANKQPICKNKGKGCYYWQNNNKHTLFSQKNKDNEVTWGFLNIISSWCSIRFTPAFSTPASYSCFFHSGIFHRCCLLLHFPLLRFPPLQFCPYRIF